MSPRTHASLLASVILATSASPLHAQLQLLSQFSANQGGGFSAGEIVAFDPGTDRLFVTSSGSSVHQVNIFGISNTGSKSDLGVVNFSATFGAASNMLGLSSVAVDPLGRFGVAALIPTANTTTLGKVGFFDLSTGAVIGTVDVGYHPDSVTFSRDGSRLLVVNEGETNPASGTNAPGSISYFNVGGITSGNLSALTSLTATTRDFSAGNLAAGVSVAAVRNHNAAGIGTSGAFINTVPARGTTPSEAIEPEYASISGDRVYVSLQENNALGVFDFVQDKWVEVRDLGTIAQTIDSRDDNVISVTDTVRGLLMPDTVGTYSVAGKTYVVTANEGDARPDDRDISRFGDVSGNDNMNALVDTNGPSNFLNTTTNANNGVRADSQLGRLNISRIDGDTDGDGLIDDPTMIGTRSFSIFEETAGGLVRVYDSGSFFETYIAANGGWVDGRSDDKGPEPEGLIVVTIGDRTYLFIGMERTGHVMMFDVTDPTNVAFINSVLVSGAARPEGFAFVAAADSPTGQDLLVVGFEGDGNALTEQIAIFTVIPEPSAFTTIAGVAALGCVALRRPRRLSRV